jgi:hypothetical protein
MKKLLKILAVILLVFSLSGCEKKEDPPPVVDTPYAETEKAIRAEYDDIAVFPWSDYDLLLKKLEESKFVVLPLNDFRNHFDNTKVVVGLRHDIDHNPFKGLEMANMEKKAGISSTYFILATEKYYGHFSNHQIVRNPGMGSLYQKIYKTGAEIGIHNDLLSVMILYGGDPFSFNRDELAFYNSLDIPIYGTASHGSNVAKATVPNYQIFSDFALTDSVNYLGTKFKIGIKSLAEFGYKYEAYFIAYDKVNYYSDSGGHWNDPEGLAGIIKKLDANKPGDRVQILAHPDWWGRPKYYLKSDSIKINNGF